MLKIIKHQKALYFTVSLVLLAGITSLALSKSKLYQQIAQSQKLINNVYKYLIINYADEIDIEEFTRNSISNMLDVLDPYTVYLENDDRESLDILTFGKYGGVGMHLGKRDGKLTVIAPMDDSPAQRAGIISGDEIIEIDGIATEDLSIDDAAKKIRGDKGTRVVLTIKRYGNDNSMEFSLVRGDIRVDDVAYTGMLDDQTGYIRLTRFSKNSPDEMKDALKSLLTYNPQAIILDLRDNPGGLLNAAIDILDMFVEKGELLLSTKGRTKASIRTLTATRDPIVPADMKLAVLINEGSASASEIVSGTLQDLDRAVVVGEPSFGKGLVQSVFDLDKTRSLKITTAKYYTPSGRLIQKPGYIAEELVKDSINTDKVYKTSKGRIVKGGGGIAPDFEIEIRHIGPLTQECYRKSVFFTFVQKYRDLYGSFENVVNNPELLESFKTYLDNIELEITLKGEKQFDQMQEAFWQSDSLNPELIQGLESLNAYINEKEATLFDEEKEDLELALLLEFAQTYVDSKKRTEVGLEHDNVVRETMYLLHDQVIYRDLLSVNMKDNNTSDMLH